MNVGTKALLAALIMMTVISIFAYFVVSGQQTKLRNGDYTCSDAGDANQIEKCNEAMKSLVTGGEYVQYVPLAIIPTIWIIGLIKIRLDKNKETSSSNIS